MKTVKITSRRIFSARRKAFSLLEVVMAIGILSFCLVAVMGLIPVGLQTSRQSMDRNTETRMLQAVRGAMQNMPYSTLPESGDFFFDADGFMLSSSTAAHYNVSYQNSISTVLPGTGQSAEKLATAQLTITNTINGEERINCIHLPDNGF